MVDSDSDKEEEAVGRIKKKPCTLFHESDETVFWDHDRINKLKNDNSGDCHECKERKKEV